MKLSEDITKKLTDIVATATAIGIEQLIIDVESIRGQSENSKTILLHKDTVDFSIFNSIGISRVKTLNSRINLIKNSNSACPSIDVDIKEKDNGDKNAISLTIKEKKTSVEFRCADPAYIKAPRNLKSPIVYSFEIDEESINIMSKGVSVMNNTNVSFTFDQDKVQFNLSDDEGDSLKHTISEKVTVDDDSTSFFFKYNKSILQLLKLALNGKDTATINITKRGILNLTVNNLTVYQAPEV